MRKKRAAEMQARREIIERELAATQPVQCLSCSTISPPGAGVCSQCGSNQVARITPAPYFPWEKPGPWGKLMKLLMRLPASSGSWDSGAPNPPNVPQ